MSRTIVLSDLHGHVLPLERALEHAEFGSEDTLVLAGDLVDVGAEDVIGAGERLGAIILAGNHEVSAAMGIRITPQNPETLERGTEFADRFASGQWPLAFASQGWLITHAGLSSGFSDLVARTGHDPEAIAAELNARFIEEMADVARARPLSTAAADRYRLAGGGRGPVWFRPSNPVDLPSGLKQIAGHTPPEVYSDAELESLRSAGLLLIEPGGHDPDEPATRVGARMLHPSLRYAVIEDGVGRVVEG